MVLFKTETCQAQKKTAKPAKTKAKMLGQEIPEFKLLTLDSVIFTNKDLPTNKKLAFIFYSPDCSHCQQETKRLMDSVEFVSNIQFFWLSYYKLEDIKAFADKYNLSKQPNMHLLQDAKYTFINHYKIATTPYLVLYNEKRQFVKEFRSYFNLQDLNKFSAGNL